MNSFERFKIKHLSPSNLNKASACLGAWVISYIYKFREPTNVNMARGSAVEHGVQMGLEDEFLDSLEEAIKEFNKLTAMGCPQEARKTELEKFPGYVEQTIAGLENYGDPTGYQEKVSIELEGVPIPIIGYTDFTCGNDGAIVDLKTSKQVPGRITAGHRRQMAVYQHANSNQSIDVLYASPKKHAIYTLTAEEAKNSLEEIRQTAMRLEKLLDNFETKEELAAVVIPDYDSFYFNGMEIRAKAKDIFGY